jgi:hypothetical protein
MIFQAGARTRRLFIGCVLSLGLVTALASDAGAVERLVDPNTVAPEYRAAAEKRRAEQLKMLQCTKKADDAKLPRRDRVAYINNCIDK